MVERSAFERNRATRNGGAVFARDASRVEASTFRVNGAAINGGALFADAAPLTVIGSWFSEGKAALGGAIFTSGEALIHQGTFRNNLALAYGGAISSTAPLTISHSIVDDNRAASSGDQPRADGEANGGAISAGDTLVIERSQLVRNRADRGAGAIVLVGSRGGPSRIANSLLARNSAAAPEGRSSICLFCGNTAGTATLAHTTVVAAPNQDQVGVRAGRGTVRVESSILTGFETAVQRIGDGTLTVRRNLLYANQANHQGVIDAGGHVSGQDPLFADADQGDFRLLPGSPAVGKAEPGLSALDLRGVHRPQGEGYDQGAYEYVPGAAEQPAPQPGQPGGAPYRIYLPLLRR